MATTYLEDSETPHNFQERIGQYDQSIAQRENEFQQQQARNDSAYQAQQQAMQNRQSYSALLSQAKQSEGTEAAKQQYQSDVEAVNAIQSAMNTLPSSINANSNVTLTNAQRQAALGNQMNKYLNSYDYATRQAATSGDLYGRAQSAAFQAAEAGATEQQQNIQNAMNAYSQEMQKYQDLYNMLANEKQMSYNTYGQMYQDEYQHMQEQLQREMQEKEIAANQRIAEMEDATKRWIQEKQNQASNYAADASIRAAQYMAQRENEQNAKAAEQNKLLQQAQNRANALSGFNQYMQNAQKQYEEANNFWNIGNWFTGGHQFSEYDPYDSDFYRYMAAQGYDQDTIDYYKNMQATDQQRYSDLFNW